MNPVAPIVVLATMCTGHIGAVSQSPPSQEPASQINDLVRASHIIFLGRIEKLRAVNLKILNPSDSTVLARVEDVLDAPPSVGGIAGQEVTLELARPGQASVEERAVFFTNGILFGEHLAVKEVGRTPVPADAAVLRREIATVRTRIREESLQTRLKRAVLVITGTVQGTQSLGATSKGSEHEPDWAQAVVRIDTVEKGDTSLKTVVVYFPTSTDERWYLSPKFRPGQRGIWLLHREGNMGLPGGGFFALTPLDFHPLEEGETIRRLLR